MFGSIQCDSNAYDWTEYNGTLISQAGLSGMVSLYTIIKLASGVVPKRILEKHMISVKKILEMRVNAEEFVQSFGLTIAIVCALYLLGNYGADGDFYYDVEKFAAYIVPSIGATCLIVTATWKMVVIRKDIKLGVEPGQDNQGESPPNVMLVEASSFWFYLGVLATAIQCAVAVVRAVMMHDFYSALFMTSLPIVILIYVGSVFTHPRINSQKYMMKLRIHFVSVVYPTLAANAVTDLRSGNTVGLAIQFVLAAALTVLFHFGLKLRAAAGRLPDKDLDFFLINTIFKSTRVYRVFLISSTYKTLFRAVYQHRNY